MAANCPISQIAELKLRAGDFSMIVRILRVHMTACEQICQHLSNFDKCNCTHNGHVLITLDEVRVREKIPECHSDRVTQKAYSV